MVSTKDVSCIQLYLKVGHNAESLYYVDEQLNYI